MQIRASGKENSVVHGCDLDNIAISKCNQTQTNQTMAIEIVDEEEYEAIEISLRLAEKMHCRNGLLMFDPHRSVEKAIVQPDTCVKRPVKCEIQAKVNVSSSATCQDVSISPSHQAEKMPNISPHLEPVSPGTDEYEQVLELFSKSCRNLCVLTIERCAPLPAHPSPHSCNRSTHTVPHHRARQARSQPVNLPAQTP